MAAENVIETGKPPRPHWGLEQAFSALLEGASRNMSVDDLGHLAESMDEAASLHASNLASTVENVAYLIESDERSGCYKSPESVTRLLLTISANVEFLGALNELGRTAGWYAKQKAAGDYPFKKAEGGAT